MSRKIPVIKIFLQFKLGMQGLKKTLFSDPGIIQVLISEFYLKNITNLNINVSFSKEWISAAKYPHVGDGSCRSCTILFYLLYRHLHSLDDRAEWTERVQMQCSMQSSMKSAAIALDNVQILKLLCM